VPRLAAVGLKMAEGRDFNAAFAATEEDGFGIAMAHILMHRLQTINKQISTSKYQQANGKRANVNEQTSTSNESRRLFFELMCEPAVEERNACWARAASGHAAAVALLLSLSKTKS